MSTGDSTCALGYALREGSSVRAVLVCTNRAPATPGACATDSARPPTHRTGRRAPRRARDRGAIDESSGELERNAKLLARSSPRQKIALFFGNHKIAEDFPATVSLSLPYRQIFLHQPFATIERRFRLSPFVCETPMLSRPPCFYRGRARPSRASKLSFHMFLNLRSSSDALSRRAAVNSVLGVGRDNWRDVTVLYSIDPGLIPSIDPGPRRERRCSALRDRCRRKQAASR